MQCFECDPLALTTAINTVSVAFAKQLNDEELAIWAAILTQVGDTLATIAVQRQICSPQERETET
ncbi:MAG: hypothetical protein MJ073_04175 [Oscillibacter sp.]|nr:hypothetical protein [Oscillibacter sp.]